MYSVSVKRGFTAEHFLIGGDWGAENQPHSHDYQVEVQLEGATLDRHGYLVDNVEIISLKWRHYGRHLMDNLSRSLLHQLQKAELDVLIQDELNHPSLFAMNRRLKRRVEYPLITLVHLLRSSESHSASAKSIYRAVERRYFRNIDGAIFNSQTTRRAVGLYRDDWRGS